MKLFKKSVRNLQTDCQTVPNSGKHPWRSHSCGREASVVHLLPSKVVYVGNWFSLGNCLFRGMSHGDGFIKMRFNPRGIGSEFLQKHRRGWHRTEFRKTLAQLSATRGRTGQSANRDILKTTANQVGPPDQIRAPIHKFGRRDTCYPTKITSNLPFPQYAVGLPAPPTATWSPPRGC